ncbi:hypothetical protein BPNPMPFG_003297 [Mesorhizobium sp. AR07]|uniref:hypothetical protein n=1 Tax=Mesorhizobium sp. AR07 TaxID=2865838 RepID=UPI00216026F8|nr:hypothetical protein [Mesorhizobium sp. AR07]UVK47514.1 hypothetical protein BPNPMPFG_003297 [Mesorhizobium sp. AR07]
MMRRRCRRRTAANPRMPGAGFRPKCRRAEWCSISLYKRSRHAAPAHVPGASAGIILTTQRSTPEAGSRWEPKRPPTDGWKRERRWSRSLLKPSERANAEYVRSALRELLPMAYGSNQKLLNYFMEMAYIEVSDMLRDDHAFQKEIGLGAG